MTSTPLRLGLIGAGRWGRNYIRTLAGIEGVVLARVASGNSETRTLAASECMVSADWRQVAEASDLDGIIIATPPATHIPIATAAIKFGLAVLVEKPLGLDVAEAESFRAVAQAHQAIVRIEHTQLFAQPFQALLARVVDVGPVQSLVAEAGNHGPFRTDSATLWDWGPHDVAMCLAVMGAMPEEIACQSEEKREVEGGSGENIRLHLTFPGGIPADIRIGNLMPARMRRFAVHCAKASLLYEDKGGEGRRLLAFPSGNYSGFPEGAGQLIVTPDAPPLTVAVQDFLNVIRKRDTSLEDLDRGINVLRVLARCDQNMEKQKQ